MKTYKKEITVPILEIGYDDYPLSPREWSNLGYFITVDRNYHSPDKHERLENIIKTSGEVAENVEEHMLLIKENYRTKEDYIVAIYPINKYEHGGVVYRLGTAHGFDYSNNGFYVITKATQKEHSGKKADFEMFIKEELDTYNKFISGEVYCFTLYKENGEVEDSCSGFYDIEDIREHLPKGWEKEKLEEYIIA